MTFAVTYRNKSAVRETIYIEATDRANCFRILREKKINAISVSVCDKVPSGKSKNISKGTAKLLIAGLVIAAIVIVSIFLFDSSDGMQNNKGHSEKKNVANINHTKVKNQPKEKSDSETTIENINTNVTPVIEDVTNIVETSSAAPKKFRLVKNKKRKVFHTISDVYISRILNTRPGHAVIGTMNYDRFAEQFKKSLSVPIVINEDDSPSEVELKKAVMETREDLKAALARGEDIAQIMRESENELRKFYNYRQNINAELSKAMRERKYNADDMQDYIDAANKMLSDNGIEPLKHPQLWIRQLRLEQAERSEQGHN